MADIDRAAAELREMDDLAAMCSPIHQLDPLAKLFVTVLYIFITVSFSKYDIFNTFIMVLYPVLMYQISGIPVSACFRKLKLLLMLVCAVGVFNPFFDRTVLMHFGSLDITGGMISMLTLMMKGIFCVLASFLLAATTPMDTICAALRRLRVPGLIVSILLLTYRYIGVMVDEISVMSDAYRLRAPDQKGIHISAWGSFLGQLLLRSMDRADELYASMQLRGFHGEFGYADPGRFGIGDAVFCLGCAVLFFLFRLFGAVNMLGSLFV